MTALFPLGVTVELLVNGTWADVTQYVYLRDLITITGGRISEGDTAQPAEATLTFNNRDGRFSPGYTGGAYYPYLKRNVQLRVSVTATSSSGNFYSGYRFWGEVPKWPPVSDLSGRDVYVQVTAAGPLRRVHAGGGKGSALTRYYNSLTGQYSPVAYWPCEEDPSTTIVGAGIDGGTDMTVTVGTPKWKAVSDFNGSAPIGVLNNSTWDGLTGSPSYSGDDVFATPGTYTWTSPVSTATVRCWGAGGNGFAVSGGTGGTGGTGGEFAAETSLALTAGRDYTFTVQPGGSPVAQTFAGDAVTVSANGGAAGGSGSLNTVHFSGGGGGGGSALSAGGGGGGSGGTAAAGNAGGSASGITGGAGAAAVAGGGKGGDGAYGSGPGPGAGAGAVPGGGGGGGGSFFVPGNGGAGKVEIIYTPPAAPLANVVRFILKIPSHGGNSGKVLLRAITGGTINKLEFLYQAGGKLQLRGYDNLSALKFDSGGISFSADGQTLMVSGELTPSGADVAWKLTAVKPGSPTVVATATGTVTTAGLGNVTEVIAAPNADITKTAMGHISVQYAVIPVTKVSRALHGHHTEMGVDRFTRLCNEIALSADPRFTESADHWAFEGWSFTVSGTPLSTSYFTVAAVQAPEIRSRDTLTASNCPGQTFTVTSVGTPFAGFVNVFIMPAAANVIANPATVTSVKPANLGTQSWAALNGALTKSAVAVAGSWPADGTHSLLCTCNGAGTPSAFSPNGTSGQPAHPGDIVSAALDVYTPAALSGSLAASLTWFGSSGASAGTVTGPFSAAAAGQVQTLTVTGTAPDAAAYFNVHWTGNATEPNGRLIYCDHVRVHPRMGPQTRRELHRFLREIEDLDHGILLEARHLWGLGYRTRLSLVNQSPAVTLDYSTGNVSAPLQPVLDDKKTKNDITVHRHKGSKVRVTLNNGAMSVQEPPAGAGRYRKILKVAAELDEQLLALASHLLSLGTVSGERYPTIPVNLARAGIAGNTLAPLMSAVAGVEIGDRVQCVNLPFWYPASTIDQLVIGYTEVIGAYEWAITWNCTPASPYTITALNLRRW